MISSNTPHQHLLPFHHRMGSMFSTGSYMVHPEHTLGANGWPFSNTESGPRSSVDVATSFQRTVFDGV